NDGLFLVRHLKWLLINPVLRHAEELGGLERNEFVIDPQYLLGGTAHGVIGGDEYRTRQLLGHAVMIERRPVGDRRGRYQFHGHDEFMQLRSAALAGGKRDDGEAAAANTFDPTLRLKLFKKLSGGIFGFVFQDLARIGDRKRGTGSDLRQKPCFGPPQGASCYIMCAVCHLYGLPMACKI